MIKTPEELISDLQNIVSVEARPMGQDINIQRKHYEAYCFLTDNAHRLFDALRVLSMTLEPVKRTQKPPQIEGLDEAIANTIEPPADNGEDGAHHWKDNDFWLVIQAAKAYAALTNGGDKVRIDSGMGGVFDCRVLGTNVHGEVALKIKNDQYPDWNDRMVIRMEDDILERGKSK